MQIWSHNIWKRNRSENFFNWNALRNKYAKSYRVCIQTTPTIIKTMITPTTIKRNNNYENTVSSDGLNTKPMVYIFCHFQSLSNILFQNSVGF